MNANTAGLNLLGTTNIYLTGAWEKKLRMKRAMSWEIKELYIPALKRWQLKSENL